MKFRLGLIVIAGFCAACPALGQTPGANSSGAPGIAPIPRMAPPPMPHIPTPSLQGAPAPNIPRISPPIINPPVRAVVTPARPAPASGWTAPVIGGAPLARPAAPQSLGAHGHERADSRQHWRRHRPITPYDIGPRETPGLSPSPLGGPTPPERYQPDYYSRGWIESAPVAGYGRRCVAQKKKVWRKGRLVRRWVRRCR